MEVKTRKVEKGLYLQKIDTSVKFYWMLSMHILLDHWHALCLEIPFNVHKCVHRC
jgi:hypothetical protein